METELFKDIRYDAAFWTESPIPHAIVSTEGYFVRVNPAWTKLLGYGSSELQGTNFTEITHPGDIKSDQREVQQLLSDNDSRGYSMVKRYITKTGSTVWVELHVSAIRQPDGSIECFAVCVIPLPNHDRFKVEQAGDGYLVRPAVRWADMVRDNPRESIFLVIVMLMAFKAIPVENIFEIIKHFFK